MSNAQFSCVMAMLCGIAGQNADGALFIVLLACGLLHVAFAAFFLITDKN